MDREFIQVQNDLRQDYTVRKKFTPLVNVWRSRPTKGLLFLCIFAIVAPVLIYYFVFDKGSYGEDSTDTCLVGKAYRIQCGKTQNVTLDYCDSIQCCFDNATRTCFHYLPSKYYYYSGQSENVYQKSLENTPFGKIQAETVALSIQELDENNVQIILHDPNMNVPNITGLPNTNYLYKINPQSLYVEVFRNNSEELILTTYKGPTIISENYWEWSFQLTDQYLFGLGQTLIELDENSTLTKVVYGHGDDHNTLPIFLAYNNGSYHGLIVRNSGPLEITVLPSKLVSLKSLAGNQIVLELSVGPTIRQVIEQQNKQKVVNVDLGMLGVHICREGNLITLRDIINDYRNEKNLGNNTQYESDCFHENLLLAVRDQNTDMINNLTSLINEWIIGPGSRFMLSLPPQVSGTSSLYNSTTTLDVFFKSNNSDYQGKYLGVDVVYPYFNHINITSFVQSLIDDARSYFSSVWPNDFILPKNWPSDDSFEMTTVDDFQYLSQALLDAMSFTLPWNVTSNNQSQFLDHNDYGTLQLTQIQNILSTENPFIMTASHTFDSNQPIILQNVDISWTNFQKAITTTLSNSIFGFPLTSIPVCGSTNNFNTSHESLCMRWYLMASTSPIFRISSDLPRRDPSSFGMLTTQHAANIATQAIEFRYSLQYYFYDVLSSGEPLMRPMFYDFSDDNETFALVEQYMVGPDILVGHPTLPDQSYMKLYLPKAVSTWFEFFGGRAFTNESSIDGWISLPIVETDWIGFIPEGNIISLVEKSAENEIIKNVKLKVALQCSVDLGCNATGTIKITNTTSFTFISNDSELTVQKQGVEDNFVLKEVQVFKVDGEPVIYKADTEIKINDIITCLYNNPLTC